MSKNVGKRNNNIFDIFNTVIACNNISDLEIILFIFSFFFLSTFYMCFQQ